VFKLTGKTLKGKNRVREFGSEWNLIDTKDKVSFTQEPGPWLLLKPAKDKQGRNDGSRWVHATHDQDFLVQNNGDVL